MYYEVFVSSQRYHGNSALTYLSEEKLAIGTVVTVPLQRQNVLGIVVKEVSKPSFTTKPISQIIVDKPIPTELLQLQEWLINYYPAPAGMITQLFLPASLSQKSRRPKTPIADTKSIPLPPLTSEQQLVIDTLSSSKESSFLLHGDTGSGKTRVYLELITQSFAAGKSALVLTPEIGLTPQLAQTLTEIFPGRVRTIHSNLTAAERRDVWLEILHADEPMVILGPRSALFSPIANLGWIIVDEAHDSAYKQEQMPYYQASRVAAYLAHLHGARLLLGTATPPIGDYFAFSQKKLPILRMRNQAVSSDHGAASIEMVDLRDKANFSRVSWLSDKLIQAMEEALRKNQQTLLFLNRRGSARLILCQDCGWQALCQRCDLPLTFHGDDYHLICHTCGFKRDVPPSCESCRSTNILFRSIGTKSVVAELSKVFPKAVIKRFDSDNAKADRLEEHYEGIRRGEADIIIGTQMLSKGLDLPKLTVVGVLMADTSLAFPDYTAEERTYQMLNQVIGRVGRGHQAGKVIVQTYQTESQVIQTALQKDYEAFYTSQLAEREMYHFPPYYHLMKLSCARATSKSAETAAAKLAAEIRSQQLQVELIGPSPAFAEKVNNRYNWQIVVKAKRRTELTKLIANLPANWSYDIDPSNLL